MHIKYFRIISEAILSSRFSSNFGTNFRVEIFQNLGNDDDDDLGQVDNGVTNWYSKVTAYVGCLAILLALGQKA